MFRELTVMVVDDQRTMRSILRQLLGQIGISRIMEAGDGSSALALLDRPQDEGSPDVIICDLHMEPMDGLQFSNEVRRSKVERISAIPILILTGDKDRFVHEVVEDVGVMKVLTKPISSEDLGREIGAAVGFAG